VIGYLPEHFKLHELLPEEFYRANYPRSGEKLWSLFDPHLLCAADLLRRRYGRMVCNTWFWGGHHQFRGFRPEGCTVGAPRSMHRFGRALDLVPVETTAAAIRADIRRVPDDPLFQLIYRVEEDVGWLHIDRANVPGALSTVFFKG